MPSLSPNLDDRTVSNVTHPMQNTIQPHIYLIAQTIEKLILHRFRLQLSAACLTLIRRYMIEMCEIYLIDAELTKKKSANRSDDGPSGFTCLTMLISALAIFQKLVNKRRTLDNLISVAENGDDNFDIEEYESESDSEIVSIEELSDSSDNAEFSDQDKENTVFAAFTFSLLTAFKTYYDEEETWVSDVFDIFARMYKDAISKLDKILDHERLQGYPSWKEKKHAYEEAITYYKRSYEPLYEKDVVRLNRLGQNLPLSLKPKYQQLFNQMKILTSFVSYNSRRKYVFSLFQIERNALSVLYDDLYLSISVSQAYQCIQRAQEFVAHSTRLVSSFGEYLLNFGELEIGEESRQHRIEYLFTLFKISNDNPLKVLSGPTLQISDEQQLTRKRKSSF
ncbi:MAG: hypothetical protein HYX61_04470 [Gammaproteobacteria bacterium]|nr:hypothetical protein [Gammaproteobacteria bacterium]